MTRYSFAGLPAWAAKVGRIADAVVSTATTNMIADIEVAPGINRGGARVRGTIPRDLGALAGSLQASLYGSSAISGSGPDQAVLVAGEMRAGDVARFSWGGAVAPYARHVHDGARGVPGTFWIDVAANGWPGYVAAAVAQAKREIV